MNTKDINADHIGQDDEGYEGGYYDYSYNYAYLDIEDTLNTSSSDGDSKGSITLTAENTIDNTFNISDYIAEYYYEYYWNYSKNNYAEIYISGSDAFYSDSGDVTITAKNDITQLIEAGYIDYFYADPDNEAYVELYNPIYSQSGNIKLEANNIVDTTIIASKQVYDDEDEITYYDGGIDYYEDYYTYSYAYVYIYDIISTKGHSVSDDLENIIDYGGITLDASNSYSLDITADYIDYFDNEPYQEAYLYIYNILTTSQIYGRDEFGNILRDEGNEIILYDTASSGQINLLATNDLTTNLEVLENIDSYYDYSYTYAYIYVENTELTSASGNITLKAANTLTTNINAGEGVDPVEEIYEYYDYSDNEAEVCVYSLSSETISTTGNIDISATNTITKDINADHIGQDDEGYEGGYYDYSYNYAYLDIEDTLNTTNGTISLTADIFTINNSITSDLGDINIKNNSSGKTFALGSGASGDIELGDSEIGYLSAGETIIIGSETAGTITIGTADFGGNDVKLISGNTIVDVSDTITADALTLKAVNSIGESENPLNTDVNILNAETTGDNASIYIDEADNLGIGVITAGKEDNRGDVSIIVASGFIRDANSPTSDDADPTTNIIGATVTLEATENIGEDDNYLEVDRIILNYTTGGIAYIYPSPDSIAPTILISVSSDANENGWNNSDVTITATATDEEGGSGVASVEYSWNSSTWYDYLDSILINSEGEYTVYFRATDNVGNQGNVNTNIKLDKTAPGLTWGELSTLPNAEGWNNANVTLPYITNDALSGVNSSTPLTPLSFATEGDNLTQDITVTDMAGNSKTFISPVVNLTKPHLLLP